MGFLIQSSVFNIENPNKWGKKNSANWETLCVSDVAHGRSTMVDKDQECTLTNKNTMSLMSFYDVSSYEVSSSAHKQKSQRIEIKKASIVLSLKSNRWQCCCCTCSSASEGCVRGGSEEYSCMWRSQKGLGVFSTYHVALLNWDHTRVHIHGIMGVRSGSIDC